MYGEQTFEAILERMLNNLPNTIDKREGSVAYDMLAPKAIELAMAYLELSNVIDIGFAATTYGEFLDLKASEAGLTRIPSAKATGLVVFSSLVDGLEIPTGTVVYTDSGIRFLTDNDTAIFNGTASSSVTAEVAGLSGNVPVNSIINVEIAEVTCNNSSITINGKDTQSDEDLLNAYNAKLRAPVASGNIHHYRQWASEVLGIGDARVIPLWNGNGTVKILLVGTDKKPVIASKVTEVTDYINSVRPIGSTITVESAIAKTITVSADITLAINYTLANVKIEIEREITEYFASASFVDIDIKFSKIGNIILGIPGVLDYSTLTINNQSSNILLAENETPVLGVVTLT